MTRQKETPLAGGASRNQLVRWMRGPVTPLALQSQFLIGARRVRPELAATLATFAFG